MLARLLRIILLSACALGAGLGLWALPHGSPPGPQTLEWDWASELPTVLALALAAPGVLTVMAVVLSALLSRNPKESTRQWWRSVWGETWASLLTFVWRQPFAGSPPGLLPPTVAAINAKVPVVLVHGFLCNHRLWDDVVPALRAQGHAVITVDLEPLFTSIDDYASVIEAAMQTLCTATGAGQAALVGHSMGGVAIRAWIRQYGMQRVAGVCTLGSPHAGTQIGAGFPTPRMLRNARQMQWQSDWLRALAASESAETRARFQIALSAQDDIVYPQRAQVLPGAPCTVFEGIGHVQMVLHPPVIAWLLQCLENLSDQGKSS